MQVVLVGPDLRRALGVLPCSAPREYQQTLFVDVADVNVVDWAALPLQVYQLVLVRHHGRLVLHLQFQRRDHDLLNLSCTHGFFNVCIL